MAQDSFGVLWKGLLLRCPDLPAPLAQSFVKFAYRKILDRNEWGALRATSSWLLPDVYTTGTITVTSGSATVTGSGTTFTAAMVGRQIRIPNGPWYTISAFGSTTSITLDRVYVGSTAASQTFEISQVYVTPASDFKSVVSIWDASNARRLRRGYTQEYIDSQDPQRSVTGDPIILASAYYSGDVPTFELWPRTTSQRTISYRYYKSIADPTDASTIIYPIGGELVMYGAIYECAKHPGTTEKPNPYFNMQIATQAKSDFDEALRDTIRKDQNIYLTDFKRAEDDLPYAPLLDLDYLRSHDPFYPPY